MLWQSDAIGVWNAFSGSWTRSVLLSFVRGYTAHQMHSGMYVIRLGHACTGHPMLFWVGKLESLLRKISPWMSLRINIIYIYISYTYACVTWLGNVDNFAFCWWRRTTTTTTPPGVLVPSTTTTTIGTWSVRGT